MHNQGYELNGSIAFDVTIAKVTHRVARFGAVSNILIYEDKSGPVDEYYRPSDKATVYPLHESVDDDIITLLLSLKAGSKITLLSHILVNSEMTYIPYLNNLPAPNKIPTCSRCGHTLTESLGGLQCPNHDCKDRLESRLIHCLSGANVPIDTEQLVDIVQFTQDTLMGPDLFSEIIVPCDFSVPSSGYLLFGNTLKHMVAYTNQVALWLYNYQDVNIYKNNLIQFILNLSIPDVTPKVIATLMDDAILEDTSTYLFLKIGAYLDYKNGAAYDRYVKELANIETRLHYVHSS